MMVAFSALLLSPHRSPPALLRIRRAPLPVCREWEPGQGFGPLAEQLDAWVDPDDTDDEEVGFTSEEMDQRRDKMLEKWADFVQLGGVKAQKAPSLVELRDVTVRYGGRDVLCNATWAVREGQVVGVLGESGCGKTTQLRLLAGELEPHATILRVAAAGTSCAAASSPCEGVGAANRATAPESNMKAARWAMCVSRPKMATCFRRGLTAGDGGGSILRGRGVLTC